MQRALAFDSGEKQSGNADGSARAEAGDLYGPLPAVVARLCWSKPVQSASHHRPYVE